MYVLTFKLILSKVQFLSYVFVFKINDLPKWNELVEAKVRSFENFNYKPADSSFRIYNEKLNWRTESRIKPIIYEENFHPHHNVFQVNFESQNNADLFLNHSNSFKKVPHYKLNWKAEPKIDSKNSTYRRSENDNPDYTPKVKYPHALKSII